MKDIISKITDRAVALDLITKSQRVHVRMDLTACNSTCPLDYEKLLGFPDFDFTHDICGINRHLDRETFQLKNCFCPRCAMPDEVAISG